MQGYDSLSNTKKIKGHVNFDNQIERDPRIYNLDRKDFKSIEFELNRTPFNFNDYIPNSLKAINKSKRPESKQSLSNSMSNINLSQSYIGGPYLSKNSTIELSKMNNN